MDDSVPWVGYVVAVLAVVLAGWGFAWYLRRDARSFSHLKEFARGHELDFLGFSLPPDMPPTLLDELPDSLQVRNCFSGYRRGERVVSFDFSSGMGRKEHWLTAVAMKRRHPEQAVIAPENFSVCQDGAWTLLYTSQWMGFRLNHAVVEELWTGLHTVSAEEGEAMQRSVRSESGLHVAPRHGR